jgi:hypothetical protein
MCASGSDGLFPARSARRDYEAYDDDDDDDDDDDEAAAAAAASATAVRRSPAKYPSRWRTARTHARSSLPSDGICMYARTSATRRCQVW